MLVLSSETSARISIGSLVAVILAISGGIYWISLRINEIENLNKNVSELSDRLRTSNNHINYLECQDRKMGDEIKPFFEHIVYIYGSEFRKIEQKINTEYSGDGYRIDPVLMDKLRRSLSKATSSTCIIQQ